MYNVGDIVRLNELGLQKLYWWQYKTDTFVINVFGELNYRGEKEFSCTGVNTNWCCILTTDYVELVRSLPINLEDFL